MPNNVNIDRANRVIDAHNKRVYAGWKAKGYPKGDGRIPGMREAVKDKHRTQNSGRQSERSEETKRFLVASRRFTSATTPAQKRKALQEMNDIQRETRQKDRVHQAGKNRDYAEFEKKTGRYVFSRSQ